MTPLERADLHAAIELRYKDNTNQDITPLLLREGLHELVDTVFDTFHLSEPLPLGQAQALLGQVVPGRLYPISSATWNGTTAATVYVQGLSPSAYAPLGVALVAGVHTLVIVDVLAGTYQPFTLSNDYVRGDVAGNIIIGTLAASHSINTGIANLINGGEDNHINAGDCNTITGGSGNQIEGGRFNSISSGFGATIPSSCDYVQLINCQSFVAPAGVSNVTYINNALVTSGPATTDDLPEGGNNLYYTFERMWDEVSFFLTPDYTLEHEMTAQYVASNPAPYAMPRLSRMTLLEDAPTPFKIQLPNQGYQGDLGTLVQIRYTPPSGATGAVQTVDFGTARIKTETGVVNKLTFEPGQWVHIARGPAGPQAINDDFHVTLRGSAYGSPGTGTPGGSYTDAQAVAAVAADLVAGNPQHVGVQASINANGQLVLEVATQHLHEVVFSTPAQGAGQLVQGIVRIRQGYDGLYLLDQASNIANIELYRIDAGTNDFNGPPATWPATGVMLVTSTSGYRITLTPLNVNAPTELLLHL